KTVFTLNQYFVDDFLVELCPQRNGRERLRFATRKNGRTVCSGQTIHFAPDRTYLGKSSSVQPFAFVQYTTAHRLFFHFEVIPFYQRRFLFAFIFRNGLQEFLQDGFKSLRALMLI